MNKTLLILAALTAVILSACSGGDSDSLLATVPKDTRFLTVVNTKNICAKAGNLRLENSDFGRLLSAGEAEGEISLNPVWEYVFTSDSGVDFNASSSVFEYHRATVFTFALKDTDAFRKGLKRNLSADFRDVKGVLSLLNNTVFIKGDRAWISPEYPGLTTDDINRFCSLKESESALSLEYAAEMAESGADISWFSSLRPVLGDETPAETELIRNILFEEADYFAGHVNFEDGYAEGECLILNSSFKPSPLALKPGTADAAALSSFSGKGNAFVALSLPAAEIEAISAQLGGMGLLPSFIAPLLSNVDGTVALAADLSGSDAWYESISALVTLKSPEAAADCAEKLKELLEGSGSEIEISADGNRVLILNSSAKGGEFKEVAQEFGGSEGGAVFIGGNGGALPGWLSGAENGSIMMHLEEGHPVFKLRLNTAPGRNSLISLINGN